MRDGVAGGSDHTVGIRALLGVAVVLTEIVFLDSYATSAGLGFVLSSVAVTIALLIQLRFAVRENSATPADIVVFIFNWLFLDLAPKFQLINMPQQLVNTSSVGEDLVATTNLICALSMLTFTVFYHFLSAKSNSVAAVENAAALQPVKQPAPFTGTAIGIAVFVCVLVVGVAAPHAYKTINAEAAVTSPATLVINRFLLFIPSATLLILVNETVRTRRKWIFSRACVIALLVLLVLITENTYTEKRNALGPVYLGLLLIGFQHSLASRARRMLLLVVSMVLVFPASSIFVHNRSLTLSDISMGRIWEQIEEHYFSINYDSWANIYTCIEIVKVHGLQWGHQLLGSVLFFVPSAMWSGKPQATGIFIGNYLTANYSMWFTNLSAPLVGEAYLDFGILGVIVYSAALAAFVTFLNRLALRQEKWVSLPIAVYTSIFLMIVLRGSLMIAMSFAAAALLSFMVASSLLSMKVVLRRRSFIRHAVPRPTMAS
jgi:hypothetical protein